MGCTKGGFRHIVLVAMSRPSHPTRIALVAALSASLLGWGSCPSLAMTPCAQPGEASHSVGGCCCGEGCQCGPSCGSENTPSNSKNQPTAPDRDVRELTKVSSSVARVTLLDASQHRLYELTSALCADSVWPHTLFAKHTCLRV
jgi:hypothetical protein